MTDYNTTAYNLKVNDRVLGFHIGMMAEMRIWKFLFRPEFIINYNAVNYNVENLSNSVSDTIVKVSYEYLDIPIMFGYKYNNFRFMVGPVGHVFIANQSGLKDIFNFTKDFKNFTLGYQAGIGFDLHNFGVDLRYEGNSRDLGDGLNFSGKKIYFAETPGRVIMSLTYVIK